MTVLITLTIAGADTGPFNLFSNVDLFSSAFETGVAKIDLLSGYASALVPDGTTVIRVKSDNPLCTNYVDINVTVGDCNIYTLLGGLEGGGQFRYVNCGGDPDSVKLSTGVSLEVCAENSPAPYLSSGFGTVTIGPECTSTTTTTLTPTTTTTTTLPLTSFNLYNNASGFTVDDVYAGGGVYFYILGSGSIPCGPGDEAHGTGTTSLAVTVIITGSGASCYLNLYKNGTLQETLFVNTAGTYTFAPVTFVPGDIMSIVLVTI